MLRKTKKVAQYNLEGKHIKTYNSIAEASRATGISGTAICNCLRGTAVIGGVKTKCLRTRQFQWRDASKYTPSKIKPYQHSLNKRTAKYDVLGNLVGVYKSRKDATQSTSLRENSIHINDKDALTSGTYQWRDASSHPVFKKIKPVKNVEKLNYQKSLVKKNINTNQIIDIYPNVKSVGIDVNLEPNLCYAASNYCKFNNNRWGREPYKPQPERWIILQYTLDGKFVKEYPHLIDAANAMKISKQRIHQAVKGESSYQMSHTACGYQWFHKSDFNNTIPLSVEPFHKKGNPILQYTLDGKLVKEYNSITQAAKSLNISQPTIRDAAMGKRIKFNKHIAAGYQWFFKNDFNITMLYEKI